VTEQEILDKLTAVFRTVFDDQSLTVRPEMTAQDVKRWDSLSHIDMIVMVEETFRIRIPTRDVGRMRNVGDLVRLILGLAK